MAKKRGLLAEINRQIQQDAKRREQAERQAVKAQAAAQRQAEQAAKQAERARTQASKALAAELKKAEQEAKRLQVEAMEAEAASKNAELAAMYEEIDGLLAATLEVDDYVDLEKLRRVVEHPPFDPGPLGLPALAPPRIELPQEPQFVAPEGAPKGLSGVFGGKKKYAELQAAAEAEHRAAHEAWQAEVAAIPERQRQLDEAHARAEQTRLDQLRVARSQYDEACREREAAVEESNRELDQLIANLGYDVEEAIQDYVAIVLENSAYPDCFPVEHDFGFDSPHRELTLTVSIPAPEDVPHVREYRYVKSKDEITGTTLTQKDQKERYSSAVAQVALRTLHEVFEADRVGRIQTISLVIQTSAIDPATGQMNDVPLAAVATDRATFEALDLANVVPIKTLEFLNAAVSKNPWGLVAIDLAKGVRG